MIFLRISAAWLVTALHIGLVIFAVWAPFSGNRTALVAHALLLPFLWVHWLLNDDTCALTILERKLRGVEASESFVHALVSPVYKIRDADARAVAWVASVLLWLVSASQVRWADVRDVLLGA